jgi:hypothetical protein
LFWFCFFCPSRPARVKQTKKKTRMTTTKQKGKKTLLFLFDRYIYSGLILRHANFAGSFSGRHSARSPNTFHRYIRFLYSLLRNENSVCCCCCCDRHRTSKDTVVTRHFLTYKTSREKWREKKILATI